MTFLKTPKTSQPHALVMNVTYIAGTYVNVCLFTSQYHSNGWSTADATGTCNEVIIFASRRGNGFCDVDLNTANCGWDGGDCCSESCTPNPLILGGPQPANTGLVLKSMKPLLSIRENLKAVAAGRRKIACTYIAPSPGHHQQISVVHASCTIPWQNSAAQKPRRLHVWTATN